MAIIKSHQMEGGVENPGNNKYYGTDATGTQGYFDVPTTPTASGVSYDNTSSGLTGTNIQSALDETEARVDATETATTANANNITTLQSASHAAVTIDAGSNPMVSINASQEISIDTSASGSFDNTTSGLTSDNIKGAIDEIDSNIDDVSSNVKKNSFGGAVAPTATDDSSSGFSVGSTWTANGESYVLVDDTIGAAVWEKTTSNDSSEISFDNAASGLTGTNVQDALDEVDGRVDTLEQNTVKNNYSALMAPTATDDGSSGYSIGSEWVYDGVSYVLVDDTVGAAVWDQTNASPTAGAGTGADGQIGGSTGTITIPSVGGDSEYVLMNYSQITGAPLGGATLTGSDTNSFYHIKVQGDADLTNRTFDFSGLGGQGGTGGVGGSNGVNGSAAGDDGSDGTGIFATNGGGIAGMDLTNNGAGGGGGSSMINNGSDQSGGFDTPSGTVGDGGTKQSYVDINGQFLTWKTLLSPETVRLYMAPGAGGGGGGGDPRIGGSPQAGNGGNGGAVLVLEVGGDVTLDSTTFNVSGLDGTDGVGSAGDIEDTGGGGGGGGGVFVLFYSGTLTDTSSSVNVSGGNGGNGSSLTGQPGGDGGDGGDGLNLGYIKI